ncbi:MAG: hypothetical protein EA340_07500 [Nitriliruptor sp.]|nr:MAG: hypothetical protein EA340_07500 [Nitriliruptor sp.]
MAAWVAGLGALLLLAAAATFLAMQWDVIGATARIAVVGGLTAAAIVGGARLRRPLPVVGSVVFHLGVLLLPIDALGLAIQLGAPGWGRWTAVGLTAVVALPPLAVAGRAPVLGLAALVGVPVAATGLAMVGWPAPALLVAGVGLALLPFAGRSAPAGLGPMLRSGSVLLAVSAVVAGVAVELLSVLPTGGVTATAAAAGWIAAWPVRAAVGAIVAVTLALRARTGDPRLVAVAIGTSVLALLHLLLPEATPRAVRLWTPAILWLAVEAAALSMARATVGGRRLRVTAAVAEVIATPVAVLVLALLLDPFAVVGADAVLAGLVLLAAGAWSVAAVRWHRDGADVPPVLLLVLALWHVLAAAGLLGAPREVTAIGALVLAFLPLLPRVLGRRRDASTATMAVDLAATLLLLLAAGGLAGQTAHALLVAVLAPLAVLPLLKPVADRGLHAAGGRTAVSAALLVVGVGVLAAAGVEPAGLPRGVAGLVVGVTALATATAASGCRPVAEVARAAATVAGLMTVLPAGWLLPMAATSMSGGGGQVGALGLGAGGLLPATFLGMLLLLDAIVDRGGMARTGAVLVLLRAVTVGTLMAGVDVEVVGAALLALGTAAALTVAAGAWSVSRAITLPGGAVAVVAIPIGWVLLGDAAVLRSAALLAAGAVAVVVGLLSRRHVLAHTGAALATLGAWSLLSEIDNTALDLWLLPVAVQLALAGAAARRHGELSSWFAYVPPILLVGVPAVLERVAGGPGWHGLLAGVLGVMAVVVGGRLGLRGPLVVGAALLVVVVAVETLTVVVSLPTWAWLTVGGIVLLLAAASIERLGPTPGEAVRNLAAGLRDPLRG